MEEANAIFTSTGPAAVHREARMGKYNKTAVIAKCCPVFEQVEKQGNENQFFLFVGPGGCWRVGPDVASYSGSVLKHPKKNVKTPPR